MRLLTPLFLFALLYSCPALAILNEYESFEGDFPPTDWSLISVAGPVTWEQATDQWFYGAASAVMYYAGPGVAQDQWLVYSFDVPMTTQIVLEWWEAGIDWTDFGGIHQILLSTTVPDDPAAFTPISTMTPADHGIGTGFQLGHLMIDEPVGPGTVHLAFRYQGTYADIWYIDMVIVGAANNGPDLAIQSIDTPQHPIFPDFPIPVRFLVENQGPEDLAFDYEVGLSQAGVEVVTVTGSGFVDVGENATITENIQVPEVGNYDLTAQISSPVDENPDNDTATGTVTAFDQVFTPLGMLFSNLNDPESAQAIDVVDQWFADLEREFALIRVPTPEPGPPDPFYSADSGQMDALITAANLGYPYNPPIFVLNNELDLTDAFEEPLWLPALQALESESALMSAPLTLQTEVTGDFDSGTGALAVTVDIVNPLPPDKEYFLYAAITEDNPDGSAGGHTFRVLSPSVTGQEINSNLGSSQYSLPIFLEPDWNRDNLRFVIWVMESWLYSIDAGRVQNADTGVLFPSVTAVESPDGPPRVTALNSVYPNPFNPSTTISFTLAETGPTRVTVYDISGRLVRTLIEGEVVEAGRHGAVWWGLDDAGRAVPSGVYLYRLEAGDYSESKRMVLIK